LRPPLGEPTALTQDLRDPLGSREERAEWRGERRGGEGMARKGRT